MPEVRSADRRDIAALIDLLAAQLSEHGLAAGREQIRRGIEVAFETGAPLLVAMQGPRAVGACLANRIASVEHGGTVLFIEELYVAPDARRRGVARAILSRLLVLLDRLHYTRDTPRDGVSGLKVWRQRGQAPTICSKAC